MAALSGQKSTSSSELPVPDSLSIMTLAKQLRSIPLGAMDLSQIKQSELCDLQRLLTPKMTKYIPHVPTPKQAAFLLLNSKEAFYGGSAGGGKALSLSTPILTRDRGWQTMGALTLSDQVLTASGDWTAIEYISEIQYEHACFEVTFNTGETVIADQNHLWSITEYKNRGYWQDSIVSTNKLTPKTKICTRAPFYVEAFNWGIDPYIAGVMSNKISVQKIEGCSSVPVKCIKIAHPSHTFLVGKTLIPTHNSDALLMGGLQYVDTKGYAGIIFRKTYADLTKPGALIDRAKEWLFKFEDVRWNEKDKKFEFFAKYGPHKETISILQFGYLENGNDKYNYQGGEYQFIGFDELTHIDMASYIYMFSRLRRLQGSPVPLRVRGASNPPDDDSGLWVKTRFIDEGPAKGRIFIPAGLDDNPYLDTHEYEQSLEELDPVTRARLRDGNWEIIRKGNMFKRDWFQPVDTLPIYRKKVRFWDMAATDAEKAKKHNKSHDPDYTVGFLLSRWQNTYYIEDIVRVRKSSAETEQLQKGTATADGYTTIIREEREPGSSGISVIDNKKRNLLVGYDYDEAHSTGTKTARAMGPSAAAERGQIKYLIGCRNIGDFFNEAESFPGGIHDDMIDGLSGAFAILDGLPSYGEPISILKDENQTSIWADEFELSAGYFTQDFNRMN